jgi:hypothetical protein
VGGKSLKKKRKKETGWEKIKLQRKTEIRAEKGQRKKGNLGWHRDRKENIISAPSIHVGALVGAGSLWPCFGGVMGHTVISHHINRIQCHYLNTNGKRNDDDNHNVVLLK